MSLKLMSQIIMLSKSPLFSKKFVYLGLSFCLALWSTAARSSTETNGTYENQKEISIQFLSNFIKFPQSEQPRPDSFNRLSVNLDWIYKNQILGKVEIEQMQDGEDSQLKFNQFYIHKPNRQYYNWIWGIGYMPIPLNDLNILEDQLFLTSPYFHREFFSSRQLIESGGYIGYKFYSWTVRAGAYQRIKVTSPNEGKRKSELAPHFIQMEWEHLDSSLGITYYNEKDYYLPQRPTFGLSLKLSFNKTKLDSEIWQQSKVYKNQETESDVGGYLHLHYQFLQNLNLGIRLDHYERLKLKDAWKNPVSNSTQNWALTARYNLTKELLFQLESIEEIKIIGNETIPNMKGLLVQFTYSIGI